MAPREGTRKGYDAPSPTTVAAFCPDQLGAEAEHLSVCTGGPAAAWYADLTAGDTCTESRRPYGWARQVRLQPDPCLPRGVHHVHLRRRRFPGRAVGMQGGARRHGRANGKRDADIDCSGSDYCAGIDEATGACSGKCAAQTRQGRPASSASGGRRILLLPRRQGRGDSSDVQQDPHVHPRGRQGGDLRLQQDDEEDRHVRAGAVVRRPHAHLRAHAEGGRRVHGRRVGVRAFTACDPTTRKCKQFPGAGGDCGYSSGQDIIGCLGQTFCKPSASNPLAGSCANKEASGAACTAATNASAVTATRPRRTRAPARARRRARTCSACRWPGRS